MSCQTVHGTSIIVTRSYPGGLGRQGMEVDPAHICVASGCGAVLSGMFTMLGERGDGVLIPAPYYPGFDFDTQVRAPESCYTVFWGRAGEGGGRGGALHSAEAFLCELRCKLSVGVCSISPVRSWLLFPYTSVNSSET